MKSIDDNLTLHNLSVRNRLVMPPLTTNYSTSEGFVTPELLSFYKARSKRTGIVIVEAASVNPEGRIVPGGLGIWSDDHIKGLSQLASTIKAEGAAPILQLNHAGAKGWPFTPNSEKLSPSSIACRPEITPVQATEDDILLLIQEFTKAAVRAQKAGFDGIEIHGAHFYLLSQFLTPLTNSRIDQYGGDCKARAALPITIVKEIRKKVGEDFPLFFRLHAVENIEGGITSKESLATGELLVDAGVDVLNLSLAVQGSWKTDSEVKILNTTSAYNINETTGDVTALAQQFSDTCKVIVITVGRLGSKNAVEQALDSGADMVAIGRQMICDPDTIGKILDGKEEDILTCDACMGCFASLAKGGLKCKNNKNLPN